MKLIIDSLKLKLFYSLQIYLLFLDVPLSLCKTFKDAVSKALVTFSSVLTEWSVRISDPI